MDNAQRKVLRRMAGLNVPEGLSGPEWMLLACNLESAPRWRWLDGGAYGAPKNGTFRNVLDMCDRLSRRAPGGEG